MSNFLYTVLPSGTSFETSILNETDPINDAYFQAHRFAACQAAKGIVSHVVRSDTGEKRYGFGLKAICLRSSAFNKIANLRVHSYFDLTTESWCELEKEHMNGDKIIMIDYKP